MGELPSEIFNHTQIHRLCSMSHLLDPMWHAQPRPRWSSHKPWSEIQHAMCLNFQVNGENSQHTGQKYTHDPKLPLRWEA